MAHQIRFLGLAFIASFFAIPALAQPVPPGTMSAPAAMPGTSSPADQAMMQGMKTMQSDMSDAPMTGNPDKDFVAMMLPHHQGAVAMAKVELQYGKDPKMRELARNIVAAQDREIAEMRAWQTKHGGS